MSEIRDNYKYQFILVSILQLCACYYSYFIVYITKQHCGKTDTHKLCNQTSFNYIEMCYFYLKLFVIFTDYVGF